MYKFRLKYFLFFGSASKMNTLKSEQYFMLEIDYKPVQP